MTTINQLREIAEHIRNLPNKREKMKYLNLQSREILNFLAGNIRKDGIAKTTANEIPKYVISKPDSSMEHVVDVFHRASERSGRNDKIREMKWINLSAEDKAFVLETLYGSLKLGCSVPIPAPIFGETFKPQLCGTSSDFNPKSYLIEQKFDGIRCIGMNIDGKIKLHSREGKPLTVETIAGELSDSIPSGCIVDGEIVSVDGKFQSLKRHGNEIEYRIFDMIFLDHNSIVGLPLLDRREIFEEVIHETEKIRISPLLPLSNIPDIDKWIRKNDVEGIVAKLPDSQYSYGGRKDWIKVKPVMDISGWVVGWTPGEGKRAGILGAVEFLPDGFKNSTLVGTGFDDATLFTMKELLKADKRVRITVKYQELTNDNRLRFPVFLRIDEVM